MDLTKGAAEAGQAVQDFAKIEPWMMTIIGMLVPGAAPIAAVIQPFAPIILAFVARALTDIAQSNGGDMPTALIELLQHISKGQPNSAVLADGIPSSADPSAQGSG